VREGRKEIRKRVANGESKMNRRGVNPSKDPYDCEIKILLLGDGGVGKSSLMLRYTEGEFHKSLMGTAGIDFRKQMLEVDGLKVRMLIWDTAGQEKFRNITKSYYKGAHGIVLVYDVTDQQTLDSVDGWVQSINKECTPDREILLVGNKIDLDSRVVSESEGSTLAGRHGANFLETSAKTAHNVESAFIEIATNVVKKQRDQLLQKNQEKAQETQLSANAEKKKKNKKKCC